jgi:hypothetical protein
LIGVVEAKVLYGSMPMLCFQLNSDSSKETTNGIKLSECRKRYADAACMLGLNCEAVRTVARRECVSATRDSEQDDPETCLDNFGAVLSCTVLHVKETACNFSTVPIRY